VKTNITSFEIILSVGLYAFAGECVSTWGEGNLALRK